MGSIARSGTWDEASSPAATRLARRFEDAWRDPRRKRKPDPADFLPEGVEGTTSPAAWLALLRADLNLRWDEGEAVRVEEYRERFPNLDVEALVALCYEEFCRREEDGQAPFPAEYDERFPDLSDRLRRVFDIHEIIGNATSTALHIPGPEPTPFPEVRQTIAGFHLVEELGRGSFARVFLAQERQLADRPVALKVARTGSREPQTLARLQHTHIVPVHSYRTDPVTGLHLLCMPYFGRVTLARLLADPGARVAPTGAELLAALDRLDPLEANPRNSSARSTLTRLPFARAIAWWGARLAEALAHAHDRGVLHRDIKPSNVLVTGDGLPMLLDFNLAGEPWADRKEFEPDHLGGTLAYMAPEHLEAVAHGEDDRLDARADLFSLGVLLFEALTGSRPFPSPTGSSVPEALSRAAEDRRREPPRICVDHPEIPAALERVIRRCLAPDPMARYPHAGELAADLQAVANDEPLRWTREPLLVRAVRKARRSWRKAVLVAVVAGSAVAVLMTSFREGEEQKRVASTAKILLSEGRHSLKLDEFDTASARSQEVVRLTENRPELHDLALSAKAQLGQARMSAEVRAVADKLFQGIAALRSRMIDGEETDRDLATLLAPFRVLDDSDWNKQPRLGFLDPNRKKRLIREVDEILFQFAVMLDPRDRRSSRRGLEICDRALAFTDDKKPWQALRSWLNDSPLPILTEDPRAESSAKSCFEWALMADRQGKGRSASEWLIRATFLEPWNAWYEFQLATILARDDAAESIAHYRVAISREPENKRFRIERARAYRSIGEWGLALDDEAWVSRAESRPVVRTNQPSR
jgi:eukaryotic-like serine/threonine-protein kinase